VARRKEKKMSVKLLAPIKPEDLHIGCLNCSTAELKASLDMQIVVGFGMAIVTKDGETIYDGEMDYQNGKEPKSLQYFEDMAKQDPDHDWRVIRHGPMHGETHQRHGDGNWVCIESNPGFA
jgi:hypothetical protein